MNPGSIDHALELIQFGFSVFPIIDKHPLTTEGFKNSVTSKEQIEELWNSFLKNGKQIKDVSTGIGISTGSKSNIWVLDIDNKEGKPKGEDTLIAWEDENSKLSNTWEVLTPSGGRHLYYRFNQFDPVGSKASLGPGIDIRGEGGYVVAPGSIVDGKTYEWEFSSCPENCKLEEPPSWLLDIAKRSFKRGSPIKASNSQLRELLKEGTLVATLHNGDEYWRRPGKLHGEHSAVLHPPSSSFPEGMLHVFTDGWPGLPEGTYGTPADDGSEFLEDVKLAMKQEREEKIADLAFEWDFVDLKKAWEAGPLEPPTILRREDGVCLFYPGKLNYLFGPPENGKSWIAQIACFQTVMNEGKVVYLDFENDPRAFVDRLASLGLTSDQICNFVFYMNPSTMLCPEYFNAAQEKITDINPSLIVVDGVSNSMGFVPSSSGRPLSPLVHDDTMFFETRFLKPLLKNPDGSKRDNTALVAIDHTPKNTEIPTIFGGQHKKAQIDGVSLFLFLKTPFGRDMDGRAQIMVDKDKPGHVRHHSMNSYIGDLAIYSRNGTTKAVIELPIASASDGFIPRKIMESITNYLKDNPGVTKSMIMSSVDGPAAHKEVALRYLREQEYIRDDMAGGRFWCTKLYHESPWLPSENLEVQEVTA